MGDDEFVVVTKDRDYKNAEALISQLKDSVKGSGGEISYEQVLAAVGYAVNSDAIFTEVWYTKRQIEHMLLGVSAK